MEVITYPAMEAAPTKLPVTGGETSNNGGWVLLFAGVALAALGLGWRYARELALVQIKQSTTEY